MAACRQVIVKLLKFWSRGVLCRLHISFCHQALLLLQIALLYSQQYNCRSGVALVMPNSTVSSIPFLLMQFAESFCQLKFFLTSMFSR